MNSEKISPIAVVCCAIAFILLLAAVVWRLPYGFYTFLRIVVCGTSAYLAWFTWTRRERGWCLIFVVQTALFNPFIQIHLTRAEWRPVDILAAGVFAVWVAFALRTHRVIRDE